MKPGTSKGWPEQGRQIYRSPDGTTITLKRCDDTLWIASVKWQGHTAAANGFEDPAAALNWAREARQTFGQGDSSTPQLLNS